MAVPSSKLPEASGAIDLSQLTPVQAVNDTTAQWRVDPLPSDVIIVNGTYDGDNMDGTPIIQLMQSSTIGTVSVVSFIYLIMSLLIILFIAPMIMKWILVAINRSTYDSTLVLPEPDPDVITVKQLEQQMRQYYSRGPLPPIQPSYPEVFSRGTNDDFSPQSVHDFRELIRGKYRLDCQIWNYRDAPAANQHIIEDMKTRSRGATSDLLRTAERWMGSREKWPDDEWAQVIEIYNRIKALEATEMLRFQS